MKKIDYEYEKHDNAYKLKVSNILCIFIKLKNVRIINANNFSTY
jgi:hypothetical protein